MTQVIDGMEGGAVRRVALVFGDSRSVDAATVTRLVGCGFVVAHACAARRSRTPESAPCLPGTVSAVVPIEVDDTRAGWAADVIARTVRQVGPPDAVVINAGLLQFLPGVSLTLGDLELRLGNDVRRVYEIIQSAAAEMRPGGRIVTVAAGAAEWNGATAAVLSMARAAVASLVKGLALDLSARRITVNNIQSGPIDADMASEYSPHLDGRIPLGWVGKPQEIASLVAYLATDASGAMTGASITIDGGFAL
jgi:3-oxoacyl-[acyl-carrier protein] reductase